jgi:uncharacterized membrane protein YhhN
MIRQHTLVYLLFGLTAMLDIVCITLFPEIRFITKPLLMPLLMLGYYLEVKPLNTFSNILLWGLFFSWSGDVLLMLENYNGSFFIGGLLSFLTAHILYISYFARTKSLRQPYLKSRPVMLLAVLAYIIELMYILWPHLGGMKIPVAIYGIMIGTMLCFALWQIGKLENKTAALFTAGAFFFVLSDSLLAINKFRSSFLYAGILIMLTYCLAQYLLARGSARHIKSECATTVNQ